MLQEDNSLNILKASSLADFLFLRKLRNEVSQNMTNLTKAISIWDQINFFLNPPPNIEVYVACIDGQRSGYLLLADKEGYCFITEVVAKNYRKKGLGLTLISFAKTLRPVLIADILATNLASRKLHEKAGFTKISQNNNILRYQYSARI